MDDKPTGYELSRQFFDFCFENPEKIRPIHSSIYFFAIEHCNRLGWKEKFGFPSQMAMDAIGVRNWRTYIVGFNDLCEWGFFNLIEKSKNQYSSNIIAIVKNTKARTKALDKAMQKHLQKHSQKQSNSIVSIYKQVNNKPLNQLTGKNEKTPSIEEILSEAQMRDMRPAEQVAENYANLRGRDNFMRHDQNGNAVPIHDWRKDMALLYSKGALKSDTSTAKHGKPKHDFNQPL